MFDRDFLPRFICRFVMYRHLKGPSTLFLVAFYDPNPRQTCQLVMYGHVLPRSTYSMMYDVDLLPR